MSEGSHSYKCRICNDEIEVLQQECGHCGLTSGRYRRSANAEKITLHCTSCDAPIKPLAPPDICNVGHRGDCGWWDSEAGAWVDPDLSTRRTGPRAVWVRGNFQGVYVGELQTSDIALAREDQRSYTIDHFQFARLDDTQKVDGPPDKSAQGQKPPILSDLVTPVIASVENTNNGQRSEYNVSLHDFRLHEWREVSGGEITGFFGKASTGRVYGVAYGLLERDSLKPPKKHADKSSKKINPTSESTPSPASDVDGNNQNTVLPDTADSPSMASESAVANCFACSFWLHLVLAATVWYCCGWQHALIFVAVSQAACWLADLCASNSWIVRDITRRNLLIALIGLLVTIGILIEAYSLAFSDDCALVSDWPIYLIAVAFGLTALLTYCWLRFILLTVWFLTLLLWCSANGVYCDRTERTNRLDRFLDEINIHVDTAVNPDIISNIVNDATIDPENPDNNRKISIDEITKDPRLLDKCGNSIYFPEVALFTKGSPAIEPRAHAQLRKLIPLLKARPDKKIIITGHADKSGDETDIGYLNNIALSDQRAAAVARWLIDNQAIDPSRVDIRGAGTSMPLTLDPDRAEYNRRVEVEIDCPNPDQRTKD